MTGSRVGGLAVALYLLAGCASSGGSAAPTTTAPPPETTAAESTAPETTAGYVLPAAVADALELCAKNAIRQLDSAPIDCVAAKLALDEEPLTKVNGISNALSDLSAMVVQNDAGVASYSATEIVNAARELQARVAAVGG